MSRSYKKHTRLKQQASKNMKKYANKKVRKTKNIPSGGAYKKVFEQYDICDWNGYWSKEKAIIDYYNTRFDEFETLEKYLIYWEKCVKRK